MRIAPQSPARDYVRRAQWLLATGSVVRDLQVVDARTVRVVVSDPLVFDPHDQEEADRLAADSARTVLEQAVHGVRLIPVTRSGYTGRVRDLTPAQLTFASLLPGVQRYDLVPEDLDRNGIISPEEVVHRIEVDTPEDVARLDWLLRDRFDDGSIQNGPVSIVVPAHPWRVAL